MTTRYEGVNANYAGASWQRPGTTVGDDDPLPPNTYALLITYDEVFYIQGTPDQLRRYMVQLDQQLQDIEAHAAAPLDFTDYEPDEDGNYPCPRCETTFEPRDYEDLAGMIGGVTLHIETDHPVVAS